MIPDAIATTSRISEITMKIGLAFGWFPGIPFRPWCVQANNVTTRSRHPSSTQANADAANPNHKLRGRTFLCEMFVSVDKSMYLEMRNHAQIHQQQKPRNHVGGV